MRATILATAICSCLVGLSVAADVDAAAIKRQTNIPAQRLDQALQSLAQTRGLVMAYRSEVVRDIRTTGAIGELTATEALTQLLSGTGLTYRYLDDKTVTIVTVSAVEEQAPAPPAPVAKQTSRGGFFERFRLAQVDPGTAERAVAAPQSNIVELEEIVVTGTHIRNINPTVSVITFGRDEIERSGQATAQDFLKYLPQNFAGGSAEGGSETGSFGQGRERFVNGGLQTGVNLRGLNSRATLTLINGRRVAPAEQGLLTADVSMIPLSAVERIEVLPDGASAIYGADAVAGVVNIILRKEFDGQESRARYGFSTEDGAAEMRFGHALGNRWDGGSFFLAGEYYQHPDLAERDRQELIAPSSIGRSSLLPDTDRINLAGHIEHEVTPRLNLFADGLFSRANTDYFEGSVTFESNDFTSNAKQHSFAAGLEYDFTDDWQLRFSGATGRSALDVLSDLYTPAGENVETVFSDAAERVHSADLLLTGKLLQLPAGAVSLAVGASHVWSKFDQSGYVADPGDLAPFVRHRSRKVASGFAEFYVPLAGSLSLSAAGRYDDYSDFGDTFNPKFGLAWKPFDSLQLRANYSTSFRAPNSFELTRDGGGVPRGFLIFPFVVPGGGAGRVPVLVVAGSQLLDPEKSTNYSFGATWEPAFAPGLSITLNAFDIRYEDRIEPPPFSTNALNNPDLAAFVFDLQAPGSARAFVEPFLAQGATLSTPFPGFNSLDAVQFGYDARTQNNARVDVTGLDFSAEYKVQLAGSELALRADATYISHLKSRLNEQSRPVERVGILGQPVDLRARATASWSKGAWGSAVAVNYVGDYEDRTGAAFIDVGSLTTVDLSVSYDMGQSFTGPVFSGLSARLSVVDLFEADPPFVVNAPNRAHFDQAYYDVRGRFVAFELMKRW